MSHMFLKYHRNKKNIKMLDEYRDEIYVTFDELLNKLKHRGRFYKLSDITYNWLQSKNDTHKNIAYDEFTDLTLPKVNSEPFITNVTEPVVTVEPRRHTYTESSPRIKRELQRNIKMTTSFESKIINNRRQTIDNASVKLPKITK